MVYSELCEDCETHYVGTYGKPYKPKIKLSICAWCGKQLSTE